MEGVKLLSDETKEAIAAEPLDMPMQQIADKYGISWYLTRNIRMRAGKYELPATRGAKPKTTSPKKPKAITAIEWVPPVWLKLLLSKLVLLVLT